MSTGLEMLDREFSVLVRTRANWKCARCGRNFSGNRDMLHCSHFHSRRHKATRFDLENAAALCWQCHWYMDHHPNVHKVWKLIHIGKERYEALAKRANQISKLDLMKIQKWIRMGMRGASGRRRDRLGRRRLSHGAPPGSAPTAPAVTGPPVRCGPSGPRRGTTAASRDRS